MINNKLVTQIPIPAILPNSFTIRLKTNDIDRARENSFTITDNDGQVLYSDDNFLDSKDYDYDIKLKNGDYQFLFKDLKEDGISLHWWNRSSPDKIGVNGEIIFTDTNGDTPT